ARCGSPGARMRQRRMVTRTRNTGTMSRISLALEGAGPHYAGGLMSGTSHDGVSAALTVIDERKNPRVRLIAFGTYPYAAKFRARLLRASSGAETGAGELSQLNF